MAQTRLLERDGDVSELAALIARAKTGAGGLKAVVGPAGIGKTRLLDEVAAIARRHGLTVARARGTSLERDLAFGAVRQLLEPLVNEQPAEVFSGAAAVAAQVFGLRPDAAPAGTVAEPVPDAGVVLHGLYWLVESLSDRAPLVLLCDDLHWFDAPSLRFVAYLANRLGELPVAIVVGSRPPEPGAPAALLAHFLDDHTADRLNPAPLSGAAVTAMLREAIGGSIGDTFCEAASVATQGNPFLVGEVVRTTLSRGRPPTDVDVDEVLQLSATSSVTARIGQLPADALSLTRAVSVLGADAHLRHAARLAGLDMDAAGLAADMLLRAEVLSAARPLNFIHPLVGAAVYNGLLPGERSSLHRQAVDLLTTEGAPADRIATHLLSAEPAGRPDVVTVLRAAATAARAQGATDVAISYLSRALAEPPPADQRLEVLLELGVAEAAATDPGAIDHLGEVMDAVDDPTTKVMLAMTRGLALALEGRAPQAIESLDELRATSSGHGEQGADLRLLAATVLVGMTGPAAAPLVIDHVAMLRAAVADDAVTDATVLAVRSFVGAFANELSSSVADMAARALDAITEDDPTLPLWFHLPVTTLIMADRDADAAAAVEQGLRVARRLGAPAHLAVTLFLRAWLALRAGELDDAEADARAALETVMLHRTRFVLPGPVAVLVDVLRERDQLEAAQTLLQAHGLSDGGGDSLFDLFLLAARGRLKAAQDRWDLAEADFERGLRRTEQNGCHCPGFIPWHSHLVLAHVGARRHGAATVDLARTAHELGEAFGAPRGRAEGLRAMAWGDPEARVELLERAGELFAEAGDKLEQARTLIGFELAQRGRIPKSESRQLLSTASELAYRTGSARLHILVQKYLRQLGGSARRRPVTGADSLTPSERRVAALAASGLGNKAIAQELFVSVKTVETHLAHVFQKLAISNRGELAATLSQ